VKQAMNCKNLRFANTEKVLSLTSFKTFFVRMASVIAPSYQRADKVSTDFLRSQIGFEEITIGLLSKDLSSL
jgi:hypothetical protein